LGITCIELAEGHPPFFNENGIQALIKIVNGASPTLSKADPFHEPLRPFVEDCLQKDPKNRLSATELLKKYKSLWSKAKDEKYVASALSLKENLIDGESEEGVALKHAPSSEKKVRRRSPPEDTRYRLELQPRRSRLVLSLSVPSTNTTECEVGN
jgi:serine/threonine protein kinase